MPRIKRYGPLAHGFNRDPEIRELRRKYADWMGYVWLEICLIADLNGGEVRGSPEQIGESLAHVSLSKRPSLVANCITNALQFMANCGWIEILTDHILVVKYAKYHPYENSNTIPTNEQTNKQTNKPPIVPPKGDGVVDSNFENFWKSYPRKVGKGSALKVWKRIVGKNADLTAKILLAVENQKKSAAWTKEGGQFIPHPATWLNGDRWEDELELGHQQEEEELPEWRTPQPSLKIHQG